MKFVVERLLLGLLLLCASQTLGADVEETSLLWKAAVGSTNDRPYGIERRIPWTGSRMSGSPDPPLPYVATRVFPKLKFKEPLDMASTATIDRLFVVEQSGKIFSFKSDPGAEQSDLVIDLKREIPGFNQVYGMAFHRGFATNRFVYLCYVLKDNLPDGSHVSRFTMTQTDPPQIDPASEKIIIRWLSGGHNGGCIKFGTDGFLYISTGDSASPDPPDPLNTGQDLSDLLSSVLRIDVDHADNERPYRVPPDNPFVSTPGARPEVWAYGFRNPWRMGFDEQTGALWVGDVGWELWEMVYRVERGGNYGWSIVEGPQAVKSNGKPGPTPISPPIVYHPHSEAASITGGCVYHGKRLRDLGGAYLYGDWVTGKIWGLRHDGRQVTWHRELANSTMQVVCFGEDNSGELYVVDYRGNRRAGAGSKLKSCTSTESTGVDTPINGTTNRPTPRSWTGRGRTARLKSPTRRFPAAIAGNRGAFTAARNVCGATIRGPARRWRSIFFSCTRNIVIRSRTSQRRTAPGLRPPGRNGRTRPRESTTRFAP